MATDEKVRAIKIESLPEISWKGNPYVEMHFLKCGGRPVIKGTRFTVAQFLAELADGRSVGRIAEDFSLPLAALVGCLRWLADNGCDGD